MMVKLTDKTANREFIEKIREISGEDVYRRCDATRTASNHTSCRGSWWSIC